MGPIFYALHKLEILRIPIDEEVVDLDISSHGGYAYAQEKNESEQGKQKSKCKDYIIISTTRISSYTFASGSGACPLFFVYLLWVILFISLFSFIALMECMSYIFIL